MLIFPFFDFHISFVSTLKSLKLVFFYSLSVLLEPHLMVFPSQLGA